MNRPGYTLIELMVVVAIIGILIALAGGGLLLARKAANNLDVSNNVRQVGLAWSQYSVGSRGTFVPGLVTPRVQRNKHMGLVYPDDTIVSPAPGYEEGMPNTGGPWVWRLAPYLSGEVEPLLGADQLDLIPITSYAEVGDTIAMQPGIAYNGWYVGGHLDTSSDGRRVIAEFSNAMLVDRSHRNLVADSIATMRRPTEIFVFMPGMKIDTQGIHDVLKMDGTGWFEATPPTLAMEPQWRIDSFNTLETLLPDVPVPALRGSHDVPVFHADGHIERHPLNELWKQDHWIDAAKIVDDIPREQFTHEPD